MGTGMTSTHLTADQVVERNLRVVDEHFHNENPVDIDKAIALYAPEIVWELPARGILYRDKEQVKEAYLKMFQSYGLHSITFVRRRVGVELGGRRPDCRPYPGGRCGAKRT